MKHLFTFFVSSESELTGLHYLIRILEEGYSLYYLSLEVWAIIWPKMMASHV